MSMQTGPTRMWCLHAVAGTEGYMRTGIGIGLEDGIEAGHMTAAG